MSLAPAEFISKCRAEGIRLQVVGDTLRATGKPPKKPQAFAAYLKQYKGSLLELLRPARIAPERETAPGIGTNVPMPQAAPPAANVAPEAPAVSPGESAALALLARDADEAISELEYARHWAETLLLLEQLPAIAWPMKKGIRVASVAAWLRSAGERRGQLIRLHGLAHWRQSIAGHALTSDLNALADFLGIGAHGSPLSFPPCVEGTHHG